MEVENLFNIKNFLGIYTNMFSKIFLSKNNLLHNISYIKSMAKKQLCVMVKANAYGHGDKEIISLLDGKVDFFGVSCQNEGVRARGVTKGNVVVLGRCDNYLTCMKKDLSFSLFSLEDCKNIVSLGKKYNLSPKFHLCLNSGMNRYGFKDKTEIQKTIDFLGENDLKLEGFYTHFSSITTDPSYTQKQKQCFYEMSSLIPKNWNTIKHIGGGKCVYMDVETDMYRTGIECYGYGNENVFPVMSIESQIVDIQKVKEGEHIGYLCGFTAQKDMTVATIPLGYADGLPRRISNKFEVVVNGGKVLSRGNICMDAFMVDVTDIDCKIGDRVQIFNDAKVLAPLIESTEYEVLTNLSKLRGKRVII